MVQMGITQKSAAEPEQISCVSEALKHAESINNGLNTYQLIPKYKGGGNKLAEDAAFEHTFDFRNVQMGKKDNFRLE